MGDLIGRPYNRFELIDHLFSTSDLLIVFLKLLVFLHEQGVYLMRRSERAGWHFASAFTAMTGIGVLVEAPPLHALEDIAQEFVALAAFGDRQFVPSFARHFAIDPAKVAIEWRLVTG